MTCSSRVLNVVVVLPLVTALTLSLSDVVRRVAPWVVLPRIGTVPRWGAIVADRGGDGRLQLVRASGQPPGAHVVAVPRASPLARRHERPHGVPDPSAHPRLLPAGRGPRPGAPRQRGAADAAAGRLRRRRSLSRTPTPTWASDRWSECSSARTTTASTTGWWAPGCESRLHADDLGPAHPPCVVPDPRDDQGRHGAAAATPPDRTTGRSPASPHGLGRPTHRPVPAAARRTDRARVHPGSRPTASSPTRRTAGGAMVRDDAHDGARRRAAPCSCSRRLGWAGDDVALVVTRSPSPGSSSTTAPRSCSVRSRDAGPNGIHQTALYMSQTAHLRPGGSSPCWPA